jgi:hypothetical protein
VRHASGRDGPLMAVADEVVERLARLEEQMRYVVKAVERLSGRDSELEANLRGLSERFNEALSAQAETFRASLAEIADRFVTREDWSFWKSLLTAALLALIAYGWSALISLRG